MTAKHTPTALDIAHAPTERADSPEHQRFRKLLGKIDAARQRLADWQEQLPAFATAYEQQVGPVNERLRLERRAWAFELELLLLQGKWSKSEKATLSRMICELAAADLGDPAQDPELLALHDRHAEMDHASGQQQEVLAMKALFEQVSGLHLGDDTPASPEDLLQRAREQMAQQAAHAQAAEPVRRRRKPTKAELRAEEDARLATQSVRDVYRKLAAALHPDRAAADATAEQRAQRHDQMARANAAYEAGDLLALLSLQLQIEQVDIAHAANVAASQVRHFNKVLAEQLSEIEAEIGDREHAFMATYGIVPVNRPQPKKLGVFIKEELQEALMAEAGLQREQRTLRGDPSAARRYLKEVAREHRYEDDLDGMLPF